MTNLDQQTPDKIILCCQPDMTVSKLVPTTRQRSFNIKLTNVSCGSYLVFPKKFLIV